MTLMFASIMTGGFFIHTVGKGDSIKMEPRDYYGISFGSFGTLAEAEKASSTLRARGGGGYIQKGSKFKLFATLYINKADADSVCQRLKNTGTDCSVIRIEIPRYNFVYDDDYISTNKMTEILELFNFVLENLYSVFLELDGKLINELDAQVRINGLKNEATRLKTDYDNSVSGNSPEVIKLKAELVSLQINLGIISEASYISENTSIEIKYYMLKIAFSYQNFVNEIK